MTRVYAAHESVGNFIKFQSCEKSHSNCQLNPQLNKKIIHEFAAMGIRRLAALGGEFFNPAVAFPQGPGNRVTTIFNFF